jgi:hypothetical protein
MAQISHLVRICATPEKVYRRVASTDGIAEWFPRASSPDYRQGDRTVVRFDHLGWPEITDRFRDCSMSWAYFLEEGQSTPESLAPGGSFQNAPFPRSGLCGGITLSRSLHHPLF